jgi:hypothetical protein
MCHCVWSRNLKNEEAKTRKWVVKASRRIRSSTHACHVYCPSFPPWQYAVKTVTTKLVTKQFLVLLLRLSRKRNKVLSFLWGYSEWVIKCRIIMDKLGLFSPSHDRSKSPRIYSGFLGTDFHKDRCSLREWSWKQASERYGRGGGAVVSSPALRVRNMAKISSPSCVLGMFSCWRNDPTGTCKSDPWWRNRAFTPSPL